jgi:transposase
MSWATQVKPTCSTNMEEALLWYTGQRKSQEEKSQHCHQQHMERYHKVHELAAKQGDVTNIARQVGLSRQGVYNYLRMKQPLERKRLHQPGVARLEPYKEYLIQRWNEGCRHAQLLHAISRRGRILE